MAILIPAAHPSWLPAQRRSMWRLPVVLTFLLSCGLTGGLAQVASREYQIKAVFLYNFAQFVEWPESAFADGSSAIVIGVLGDNPFGEALQEVINGENLGLRTFEIRHYAQVSDVDACHVLFISQSESGRLSSILAALANRPVLTVGDTADFARRGGMIRLVTENNRIRMRINLRATKAANLVISSKLLRAAELVGK